MQTIIPLEKRPKKHGLFYCIMLPGGGGFVAADGVGPLLFMKRTNAHKFAQSCGGAVRDLRDVWHRIAQIWRDSSGGEPQGHVPVAADAVSIQLGNSKSRLGSAP